ncbi:MAG: hypothetical protein V3S01_05565 [Dehalococcoidia bacterium]
MMRRTILGVLLCAIMLAGCASISPQQEWAAAGTLYFHTLNGLSELKEHGFLTDEDKAAIEPYRKMAREAVNVLEEAAATDDSNRMKTALRVFNSAIDEMLKWLATGQMRRDTR